MFTALSAFHVHNPDASTCTAFFSGNTHPSFNHFSQATFPVTWASETLCLLPSMSAPGLSLPDTTTLNLQVLLNIDIYTGTHRNKKIH